MRLNYSTSLSLGVQQGVAGPLHTKEVADLSRELAFGVSPLVVVFEAPQTERTC